MSDYIGLMSGTSLDGVDAALVRFSGIKPEIIGSYYYRFNPELRTRLKSLCYQSTAELLELGSLDTELGNIFAQCINTLLLKTNTNPNAVTAIGSHGQTIFHSPLLKHPFSLQIGNPNQISKLTGIPVVTDFRRADIAVGGQGAPLVPAFHKAIFQTDQENRVILNIGGIANITVLPKTDTSPVIGFDTGPGNTLLDSWILKHKNKPFDENSCFGRAGNVCPDMLANMLKDQYFSQPAPKSTGQEHFSMQWLDTYIRDRQQPVIAADVQATLYELTATTIADAIHTTAPETHRILVCGGGIHNPMLMEKLTSKLPQYSIESTETLGINPDWVEAMAFAWLAYCFVQKIPGNLPSVTGALRPVVLGGHYLPD
ncbi:MAG TPA: anhydro-N-acetylmuramic acid kinase [Crenotrichaceae bacterium]|nr:anhydro-N-acetylmuramic acid kinase [Crenotrichaceae bacterium]